MTHPSDVVLSMLADSGLPVAEAEEIRRHVEDCGRCTERLAALQKETRLIAAALAADVANFAFEPGEIPGEAALERTIPPFSRPAGLREFALANVAMALLIWLAGFLWKTLFGELLVNAAEIAASTYVPTTYEVVTTSINYYVEKGTAMFSAYLGFVCLAVGVAALLWWGGKSLKRNGVAGLCLLALVGGAGLSSEPVSALELRYDESIVTVAESETIDDTMLVAAETVLVKGNVTGDLLVAGRRVEVDGNVDGNLIAFAETVTVRGSVGGTVISAASRVELREATAGGDLWAAAETVSIDDRSKVLGNATLAGDKTIVESDIGRDLSAMAETVELDSSLGGDLAVIAGRVRLLDNAHVRGDARLRLDSEDKLYRADSAQVDGQIEFLEMPEDMGNRNRYTELEYYLWQLARLVSAVLVGLALLWLFPGWRTISIGAGLDGLKTAGIGLLALIVLPVVAFGIAFTVVGLPFSFLALVLWLVILYLAKIIVGVFVGRSLLAGSEYADNLFVTILVGILLVILVVNLPWIGGLLSVVMTIVGAGIVVQRLQGILHREERY